MPNGNGDEQDVQRVRLTHAQKELDLREAEQIQKAAESELEHVRASAGQWRTALGGVLVVVLGFGAFGREEVAGLAAPWEWLVGALLAGVALFALLGLYEAAQAAFGDFQQQSLANKSIATINHEQSVEAADGIKYARKMCAFSVCLAVGAIAILWYAPPASPSAFAQGARGDQQVCGELKPDDGTLMLSTNVNDGTTENLSLGDLGSVKIVNGC
jgi:hypothetical protein